MRGQCRCAGVALRKTRAASDRPHVASSPTRAKQLARISQGAPHRAHHAPSGPSAMIWPIRRRGLSDAKGSWNTIWMWLSRSTQLFAADSVVILIRQDRMVPASGSLKAHDETANRALARTRLADQPQRLASPYLEAHILGRIDLADRAEHAPALVASLAEVVHRKGNRLLRLGRPDRRRCQVGTAASRP